MGFFGKTKPESNKAKPINQTKAPTKDLDPMQPRAVHYAWQSISAAIFMWLVLLIIDWVAQSQILWAVAAASIGASTFSVFVLPRSHQSNPFRIVGAYVVAVILGEGMRYVTYYFYTAVSYSAPMIPYTHIFEIGAAISFFITLLALVALNVEHPPAAGLSLMLVLDIRDWILVGVVLVAIIILAVIKLIFYAALRDLY